MSGCVVVVCSSLEGENGMTIVRVTELICGVKYVKSDYRKVGARPPIQLRLKTPMPEAELDRLAADLAVTFAPPLTPGKPGRRPNRELNDRLLRQRAAGVTIPELAEETGLTEEAIERQLRRLRNKARGSSVPASERTAEPTECPAPNDQMYPKRHPPFMLPAARKHADKAQAESEWRDALPDERCNRCKRIKEELHVGSGCCGMCHPVETSRSTPRSAGAKKRSRP